MADAPENMQENEEAKDASTSTDASLNAFEEERQVLLQNMSEQLTAVIERMARANANLDSMASDTSQVQDIATMWRASYPSQSSTQQSDRSSLSAPGLG